jgi:CheY-like chemotaxis protein
VNSDRPGPVVLVVEDDGLVREDIVSELRRSGLRTLEASTAGAALELFRHEHVDVLVTDIQLGGTLTGWDLAEALRTIRPGLRVIYASGNPVNESRRVPHSRFFSKPCLAIDIVIACRANQ